MGVPYLYTRNNGEHKSVHRAVMERHLGRKLRSDEIVHHANGDKRDNRLENLQVVTANEHSKIHNQIYAETSVCVVCGKEFTPHPTNRKNGKLCSIACKRRFYDTRPIIQLSLTGEVIREWNSVREAERELNLPHGGITACCRGRQHTSHNFIWRYKNG